MKKKTIFFIAFAVFAIIVLLWFAPIQKSKYVHIVSEVGISQGTVENNTEMESIKVHGTFWNDGSLIAKNLTATVIFTDAAHNKTIRKNVPVGGDLLANKGNVMEFDSEYLRERTVPKTDVNVTIQFNWMENGQLKTTETFLSGNESDSPDKDNNTKKFIYGNATVESIEIMVLESFPVQIKVNARGYLPDGCTKIDEIVKEKKNNTFLVSIKTVRPADTFCTQVIVPFQEVISLEVYGLKAGIYTVDVNGVNGTFELETDNIIRE